MLWASDISRRQPPYGEVDFVGVIVLVSHTALEERYKLFGKLLGMLQVVLNFETSKILL